MMDFTESLIKLNQSFDKFINDYKFLDNKEPFTDEILANIAKIFNTSIDDSSSEIELLEKRSTKLEDGFKSILKDYYKKENQRKNELKEKLKELKIKNEAEIDELKIKLKETKLEYEKNEFNNMSDIQFYIESSAQNIDMFEIEYKDNLNRFSYQAGVAKTSYNENIDTFNEQLDAQIEKVTAQYKESVAICDKNFNDLVESYNMVINEKNKLIDAKKEEYHIAQVNLKNKKRNESTELNNLIRQYSEEKSNKIENFRTAYNDARANDNAEKQAYFDDYKNENFRANKDFVTNINDLDNKIKDLREKFEKYCESEKQTQYYTIFSIHEEQEKIIKQFLIDNKNNQKIKSQLKKINKLFYSRIMEEHRKTEKLVKNAEKNYLNNTKQHIYEKKILDISRTSFFAKLTEKQIRDNKYYQEKTNGYENIFNYYSNIAVNEYNKQANKVLLDSAIRNLHIEKEIDETDAKYQIQIETLTDVIKKYQLEISIADKLNRLNHLFLDEKYNREISFLTVSNLLKIEKCKVLDQYNKRQYELNIENSLNVLEYSKKKINLQNEKYEALKKQDIAIQNMKLQNIISNTSYNEYCINQDCSLQIELFDEEFNLETNLNKYSLLTKKYIVELDEYQNILQTYIILYNNVVRAWNDIIDEIFNHVVADSNKLLSTFLDTLEKMLTNYLVEITNIYSQKINKEITEHISFDNDLKYKDVIEENKRILNDNLEIIHQKEAILLSESEQLKTTNDDCRLKVFTLQYETSGENIKHRDAKKTIKELLKTINSVTKRLDEIDEDLEKYNKEKETLIKKHNKIENGILSEQEINSYPYNNFNKNVSNICSKIIDKIKNVEIVSDGLKNDYKQKLRPLDDASKIELFENTSSFSEAYQTNYLLAIDKVKLNHQREEADIKEKNRLALEKTKRSFDKTNSIEIENIKSLTNERNEIEKRYNTIIKNNDIYHKKEISQILLAKNNSTNQFYTELYAVGDNLTDIEKDYNEFVKKHSNEYENKKQQIIDETIEIKNSYNESLSNYIKHRRAIINHLPSALKENEKELIQDTKNKNRDIELKLVQNKKDFQMKKRQEKKNLSIIQVNYNSALLKIDSKDKIQKIKEKKNLDTELARVN